MNVILPNNAEFVMQPPASPILPDETGLAPGFSQDRVQRLFTSRPVLAEPEAIIEESTSVESE